jgi:predicted amidohydrolase
LEAREISQEFMAALKEELMTAIAADGPVHAIAVCGEKAPGIARQLADRHGWSVRRTSLKPRNPENAPDAWERAGLTRIDARRTAGESPETLESAAIVATNGQREFRYLKAIPTAPLCLTCHGEQIPAPVQAALQERYPRDTAVGFRVGDLRGAFSLQRTLPAEGTASDTPVPSAERPVTIALCQIVVRDGDREGNFARIEAALTSAKEQGAKLACFPETALLGWVNPEAHEKAHPIPGPDTDRLGALAREFDMYVSVGLAEKDGDRLFDAAVLIDPQGAILLKHRKINILTELMTPPYTPGETVEVVDTPLGRIGMLICADSFLEPLCARLRDQQPDLVLIPYGWAAEESAWPEHGENLREVVRQAARWIGAPVIGTDAVGAITHGPWTGKTYGGQSTAANAHGHTLANAMDRQADVVVLQMPR